MNKKNFYRKLIALVIPMTIQNFMLSLVSATDAVMLGKLDQNSMSAVSQAGQIQFFLNILVMGLSIGAGIMTAQYWGKRDAVTIEKVAATGLKLVLVIGGLVTLAALLIPETLMKILTNDPDLIPIGKGYIKTVALSYLICGITQMYLVLLKNTGHAVAASVVSSTAVVSNIVLNAVLIFGLLGFEQLGVKGAALATVISRIIELVLAIIVTGRIGAVQLRWSRMFKRIERLLLKDYARYTTPVVGASLVWGIAFMLYNIIMGHLGSDAVAANSVTAIVKNLTSCIMFGVGGGTGVIVGNTLGTGDLKLAKEYGARLTKIAFLVGIATGVVIVSSLPIVLRVVSLTSQAVDYLQITMIICGVNVCAQSINHVVLDGIFGAGGDSIFDMKNNIIFMWCFTVPLGLLAAFVFHWPVPIVYLIVNSDEVIKLPAVFYHYKKYIWLRDITRDTNG